MADKRKVDTDDITGPGGQPRPRAARRETTAGDDTAGSSAPTADGPDISQALEEPTATAAGDLRPLPEAFDAGLPDASSLLGGALGRGRGGGPPPHSSAPPTPVIQSPPHNPAGGSVQTGHGSVSSGQNQISSPGQKGTGQPLPHGGDSGGHSGQPSSSGASAPSPVSGDAGASDQQYRAGLGKLHAGLQKSERILDRPISIRRSELAPKWRSSSRTGVPVVRPCATAPSPVPAPPPRVLWESLLPQELQEDLEELNEEVEEVTEILTQICKACGRLSGSNHACIVCRRG